jgi:hypothetical protein
VSVGNIDKSRLLNLATLFHCRFHITNNIASDSVPSNLRGNSTTGQGVSQVLNLDTTVSNLLSQNIQVKETPGIALP